MITKEDMGKIAAHVGERVTVVSAQFGKEHRDTDELREVTPFHNVVVGPYGIPLIGYGCAVRLITTEAGETIYANPAIPVEYCARGWDEMSLYRARSFGGEIIAKETEERVSADAAWKAETKERAVQARAEAPSAVDAGAPLVKPELEGEWRHYVAANSEDGYSFAIIKGTLRALEILSGGGTPKQAGDAAGEFAETGFQAGCVASGIAHFHERGEEFRVWWNGQ